MGLFWGWGVEVYFSREVRSIRFFPRIFSFNKISPRRRQIIEDPEHSNATEDEVVSLVRALKRIGDYQTADKVRKAFPKIPGRAYYSAKILEESGIDPDLCDIQARDELANSYLIDGLTITQWRLLNRDDYFPKPSVIEKNLQALREEGKTAAAEAIERKYEPYLMSREEAILARYHIAPDINYEQLTRRNGVHIDGFPPKVWQALNDPEYTPQISHLKFWIYTFENSGMQDEADYLRDKYDSLLHPPRPEPRLSLEESKTLLGKLFGAEYVSKYEEWYRREKDERHSD